MVEDEPIVALDIRRRLGHLGYAVVDCVSSGEAAARAAETQHPDLVLMDIMLEGDMDGIDAAAVIRKRANIPVIYLTAFADEETLHRAKITEPFGYIIKPFEDRELETCIQMALFKHKMDARLQRSERWLSTTLRSIGDAVISTDREGRIRFMNPVAEHLCAMPKGHALGQPLQTALRILDENTGEDLGILVDNALRQRRSFCLKESAILVSRKGEERPIDLSASAIVGESPFAEQEGDIHGVVLVFRDMTDARRTEAALKDSVRTLGRTLEEIVAALATTTEKRDPYTAGHQLRVGTIAEAIARDMRLTEDQIQGIRVASLLHDIGKIYIPAEILSKPAMLTIHEMNLMKTHPEVGYDILKGISFPWPVAEMVLQHHERLDGTGYPRGMRADTILMESRIIMVADVVEAMSSHRPYRAALGLDLALEEIEMHAGTRYDPLAVRHCLRLFRERGFAIT
ncbi:putative PAS/PAC sensor protein [Megalodesulfovibrio gigas DSM 1382 = ATCC 19364]|uniref:Putative PAS/PAC sensor protein n=1 Tax=Megalodesulfovibrio gigas (strain ATCC 19364 / DSM 1382 / NCIMB 9332 / VKM B-1759) TaxID=1121448 RepID=T2GFK8_MEGG1|nr:putative PAS/PAC sensor protein [Megalodesulfovibrio gigas DSM 1382 = ATCC 19364]